MVISTMISMNSMNLTGSVTRLVAGHTAAKQFVAVPLLGDDLARFVK